MEHHLPPKERSDSATKIRGVFLHKKSGRFRVHFNVIGKYTDLGYFDTPESAACAANKFRLKEYGEFSGACS